MSNYKTKTTLYHKTSDGFVTRKLGVAGEWSGAFRTRVIAGRKCGQNSRDPLRGFRVNVKKWMQYVLVTQNNKTRV